MKIILTKDIYTLHMQQSPLLVGLLFTYMFFFYLSVVLYFILFSKP